jgi:hypothetical protein
MCRRLTALAAAVGDAIDALSGAGDDTYEDDDADYDDDDQG